MPATSLSGRLVMSPLRAEGRHGAAQLVGLGRGEAGADDGDLHRLLLEQRHAQGLAQHLAQLLRGVVDLSSPLRRRR